MPDIKMINDTIRQMLPNVKPPHRIVVTSAVAALKDEQIKGILLAVKSFNDFDSGNAPYGEHDFGRVLVESQVYFWKFDYYDESGHYREDGDRVLTIMSASEH